MNCPTTRREHLAALVAGAALGAGLRPASAQTVPWSSGTGRPTFALPLDATDCHHHFYDARFPAAPGATSMPR